MSDIYSYSKVEFNPFAGPEIIKLAPATEAQLEIWTSVLIGGNDASKAYNESVTLLLYGDLDKNALILSLENLIHRHEALRSVFGADGRQVCILKCISPNVNYQDFSHLNEAEQTRFINEFLYKDADQSYDLVNGPLFRIALFKQSEKKHCLIFSAHHIVCDSWSLGIILRDISHLYKANHLNVQPDLKPAPSFSQYAVDQFKYDKSPEQKEVENYWLDQYKNDVPVLNLPTDFDRPAMRTYKSKRDDYLINADLVTAIKKTGTANGCTFVTTLVAAFEIYLYQLTNQTDIVLGLPSAGQSVTGYYDLVSHAVNLLPLRTNINADKTFSGYLRQRKSAVLDAFEHQNLTFGSLLKKLNIKRDPSRVPLVPVVLNIDMGMDEGVDFGSLGYKLTYNPRNYETFELFLNIADAENGLQLEWSYNTQLFKPETIKQMMEGFEKLLFVLTKDPDISIKDISLADHRQLHAQLKIRNSATIAYPSVPVHELIDNIAEKYPLKTAVIFNDAVITYQALITKANLLARVLIKNNIKPDDKIGIAFDRSTDMIVSLLAVLKAGAAYVPLDITYPQERLKYMLEDSEAKLLLTSSVYQSIFAVDIELLFIENVNDGTTPDEVVLPVAKGDDLAYILYTSGSTGQPKGVAIEHHSLVNFLYSMQNEPGITADDKLLAVTTISFDIAGLEIYLPLITGATLVLADSNTVKDGRAILNEINKQQISIMQATPTTWKMLLDAGWHQPINLKVLCGGEALNKNLADKILDNCSELWNMYGPTETTIWSTVKQIKKSDDIITVGRPINNTQVYILDDNGRLVADGSVGEICLSGAGVARGYYNKPALTASKFTAYKFLSDTLIYHTGDSGKIDNAGELVCLGRTDQQIKIRGFRIEAGEIENQLLKLADVSGAVVTAITENEDQQKLVAFITTGASKEQHPALIQYWKTKLKAWLPAFMIPSEIYIVSEFPLTLNGKIDRKALAAQTNQTNQEHAIYVAPETAVEKQLAVIWSEIMGIEKISIHDDFFELGGHSLMAAQMMTAVEKRTGKYLPLAVLFSNPTIEKLAENLEEIKEATGSLVAIKPTGNKMPVFMVHGAGLNVLLFNFLARYVDNEQPVYALQAKGLNGVDEPATDVTELAAYYITEVMKVSKEGPVALAGYSLGGTIALEMAHQLQEKGREVKMVGMIDTLAEINTPQKIYVKLFKKIIRQFGKLGFVISSMTTEPVRTVKYQRIIIKNKIKSIFSAEAPENDELLSPLAKNIYNKLESALYRYILKPYSGKIVIFKAKVRAYYMPDQKFLGWKSYAKNGIKVYEVPGDHREMFDKKNNKIFAEMLQDALDNS